MEAGFTILAIIVSFIVGVFIGNIINRQKNVKRESSGIIYVDCRDPELKPGLFLEAEVPVDIIAAQEQILFDVKVLS